MNLHSFQQLIDETILDRGHDYHLNGKIIELQRSVDGDFIFQALGSEDYDVVVKIDGDGTILYSSCDCPYDYGPICKHEVAAFYDIFERFNNNGFKNEKQTVALQRLTLSEVLQNLSKNELIKIIEDIANEDTVLEERLIFTYSKADHAQEIKACKRLIANIVDKYLRKEGFITYRNAFPFTNELGGVLEKAVRSNDPLLSIDIAFLVLNEGIAAFGYADDSDGDIGLLVNGTIEVIDKIVQNSVDSGSDVKADLFNKLMKQSESSVFEGWEEFRTELLRIGFNFAENEQLRNSLRIMIESFITNEENDRYQNEDLLKIVFDLIKGYGSEQEAEQFITNHLQYKTFRELLIKTLMDEKNYLKVIEVALEAEQKDSQFAGLVTNWKRVRYEAYKQLSKREEQFTLAMELFLGGDFNFYKELKELNHEDDELFYHRLKGKLKLNGGWKGRDLYLRLIQEENDVEELLDFVRNNPVYIEEYAELLAGPYKEDVINIYQQFIHWRASHSSNRKNYQDVCRKIKKFSKIAGKDMQAKLVTELRFANLRRPAFLDELSKLR
ncbi:hypothetical protein HHO41_20435 [Bacillus sp. DNRA2]|uniref:SWIM zinc finger family protein n=1 Tax=Bacillus sp. DNRA2 TaxID=2723053 RepID=UPI00145ECDB3|nr:hypothetical protein [Bacillus sp. DNRA2]NMD72609.1 hypothetical protein [Bacillus sp. DNRA2]